MNSIPTVLDRDTFRESVFKRDGYKCVICGDSSEIEAHHILDRSIFQNGGYYINNGITLCPSCHLKAEKGIYTCDELRKFAKITEIILPENFDPNLEYDKFGDEIKEKLIKYPRTIHLQGSGISKDDSEETIPFENLFGKYLVIEEKIDGANTGISFNNNCDLLLQCRGHYLKGGRDWPEFDLFKTWANIWKDQLFDILTDRYIMYGEWMGVFHSVFYNSLPHFFMEFDIYDKQRRIFLSTKKRKSMLEKSEVKIHSVRIISEGLFNSREDILKCIGTSAFTTDNSPIVLENILKANEMSEDEIKILMSLNKDRLMEGLYIKEEDEDEDVILNRYKFVRPCFVQAILSYGKHWKDRTSIPNIASKDLFSNE